MYIKQFSFNNPFMQLYVASMQRIFAVKGYVNTGGEDIQKPTLDAELSRKNLVTVALLPTSEQIEVLATPYSAICESVCFSAACAVTEHANFFMRIDDKFFPVTLIDKCLDSGNKHASVREADDVGLIATDNMGYHYWASNKGFAVKKRVANT